MIRRVYSSVNGGTRSKHCAAHQQRTATLVHSNCTTRRRRRERERRREERRSSRSSSSREEEAKRRSSSRRSSRRRREEARARLRWVACTRSVCSSSRGRKQESVQLRWRKRSHWCSILIFSRWQSTIALVRSTGLLKEVQRIVVTPPLLVLILVLRV